MHSTFGGATIAGCPIHPLFSGAWVGNFNPQPTLFIGIRLEQTSTEWPMRGYNPTK